MPAQPYYPRPESEQVTWLTNYRSRIVVDAPACGIDSDEVTDTQADLVFLIWLMQTWNPTIQQYSKAATAYKTQLATGTSPGGATVPIPVASSFGTSPPVRPPGVLTRLFNQVARIKLNSGYTEAIGQSLRIIGTEVTVEHPYPVFTLTIKQGATSQQVQIDFTKFTHDGVYIESRRNTGAWEFLAIDTVKPYVDDRPLLVAATAETREYRMRWWDKGEPTGDWSPAQKVTVGA